MLGWRLCPETGDFAALVPEEGARVESPVRIENRSQLVYLLTEAAELEHGILCCYLFGSFSMKDDTSEGITQEQLDAIRRWRSVIREIVLQEMVHLASVCNLLTAVGGAPQFRRPNLPTSPRAYPPAFQLRLMPFGREAIEEFIASERPEGLQPEAVRPPAAFKPLSREPLSDIFSSERHYETVGHLYRGIEDGFKYLAQKLGEQQLFLGPPQAQTADTYYRLPGLIAVTDLASALAAIQVIVEQGEGATEDLENCHYGRFLRIHQEYDQILDADPKFEPGRNVLVNPYAMLPSDLAASSGVNLVDDPLSADMCNLFDGCYELMVQMLGRLFVHAEETEAQFSSLARTTVGMMNRVLEPLGSAITAMPAGPSHPGFQAGPSFRLSRSAAIPTSKTAAWAVFQERLAELLAYCAFLQTEKGAPPVLSTVRDELAKFAAGIASQR